MNKVVFMMSVSLDGYHEAPGPSLDWQLISDELHQHFNDELAGAGAFLDGRRTYELMINYWPTADEDPAAPAVVAEFARIWRGTRKFVYSTTLQEAAWDTTIVRSVEPAEVVHLLESVDGDLFVGGAELMASFQEHDLIDEYRLYVHPIALGAGTPVFRRPLSGIQLHDTRTFANGVVQLVYRRSPT